MSDCCGMITIKYTIYNGKSLCLIFCLFLWDCVSTSIVLIYMIVYYTPVSVKLKFNTTLIARLTPWFIKLTFTWCKWLLFNITFKSIHTIFCWNEFPCVCHLQKDAVRQFREKTTNKETLIALPVIACFFCFLGKDCVSSKCLWTKEKKEEKQDHSDLITEYPHPRPFLMLFLSYFPNSFPIFSSYLLNC